MNIKLTKTIRQTAMGVLRLSIKKQRRLRTVLTLMVAVVAGTILGQNYKASPTGWTSAPSTNLTKNGTTYTAKVSDGTYIMAKAVIDNDEKTIKFTARKSSGTFDNKITILLYKDISISGSTISSWGTKIGSSSASAGSSEASITITPDFTSGSHEYRIILSSTIWFYTNPITITAEEETVSAPNVTTWDAQDVTTNSATLRGSINPNGAQTGYAFWWGTSTSSLDKHTEWVNLSAGTSNVSVTATLTGLSPNTTYYYKLGASNTAGAKYGTIKSFTTDEEANISVPNVTTWDAQDITANSATLRGSINPNGAQTGYAFWWGTSTSSLDNHTEWVNLSAGTSNVSVTAALTGLSPNTTYYYKLGASNTAGAKYGTIKSFSTASGSAGGDEIQNAVTYLHNKGIVDGSTATAANADGDLLRQDLAKMAFLGVYKGASKVPSTVASDNFPTVYDDLNTHTTTNDYYYRAARALLYLEYGDGVTPFDRNRLNFFPSETITRLHTLKVLMETFNIKPNVTGTSNPYPQDADLVSLKSSDPFLMGYVREAYARNIISSNITQWNPFKTCTRGQAMVMLHRIMQMVESGAITDPSPSSSDYFEPLNTTLKTISMSPGLQLGNFQHYTKTSFTLDGVVPLDFTHAYNSYNTTLPEMFFGQNNKREAYLPLSDGWTHTYHTFITTVDNKVIVHWGGGSIDVYELSGSTWKPVSMGVYDELTTSPLAIKTKSQVTYYFEKSYSGVAYLTRIVDRNNNTLTVSYATGINSEPRISSVSDGNGRKLTFSYKSGTNLISSISDPLGRSVKFDYKFNNYTQHYQLKSFTNAKNQTTTYAYVNDNIVSTSKLLASIKLPNGNYINNTYNDNNYRLTQTENGDSKTNVTVTSSYGSSVSTKSQVKVSRANGTSTYNYTYNANNVMTSLGGPEDMQVTVTPYTTTGKLHLPKSITTNSTNISNITYDERGNVLQIDVKGGNKTLSTRYEYNGMNDVTKVTDPMGYVTSYTYNGTGNLTKIQSPISGVYTSIDRNGNGTPSKITNGEGVSVSYGYDTYGNPSKITLPGSLVTVPIYDTAGRLTSLTDALNKTYTYSYDNNDNLISEKDPANNTTTYGYDDNDNLTSITNAKNRQTTLEYDFDTDWLTSVEFEGYTKNYSYNADGSLDTYTKPDGNSLNYKYDELGRVTYDGVNSYNYDSNMHLTSVSGNGKTISFDYDGFNRIKKAGSVSYTYDDNSNVKSVNNTKYEYDKLNRLTTVSFSGRTITYTYRKDSQLSEVNYNGVMTTTFGYDTAGRLTSKQTKLSNGTVVASYSYTLDKVGNITKQTKQEPFGDILLSNEDVSYYYNTANRITKAGDISFFFDENGNTTKRGSEAYEWDKLDRLTRAGSTNITYDPLGLIASYGDITFTTDPLGIGNVLSDSKSGATYIYGNGLEARVVGSKVSYYVTDFRGSVVAIVDESGNITHKYQYDEFGKVTQKEEPAGDSNYNPFQYVGKYGVMYLNDHQYYMRARHYDPTIGRFLSEDPIWSTNLYPYAENNPINGIDPKGLYTDTPATREEAFEWVRVQLLLLKQQKSFYTEKQIMAMRQDILDKFESMINTFDNQVNNNCDEVVEIHVGNVPIEKVQLNFPNNNLRSSSPNQGTQNNSISLANINAQKADPFIMDAYQYFWGLADGNYGWYYQKIADPYIKHVLDKMNEYGAKGDRMLYDKGIKRLLNYLSKQ